MKTKTEAPEEEKMRKYRKALEDLKRENEQLFNNNTTYLRFAIEGLISVALYDQDITAEEFDEIISWRIYE